MGREHLVAAIARPAGSDRRDLHAPVGDLLAVRHHFNYVLPNSIEDVQRAIRIRSHVHRVQPYATLGGTGTEASEQRAIGRQLVHAIGVVIRYVEIALAVQSKAVRRIEQAIPGKDTPICIRQRRSGRRRGLPPVVHVSTARLCYPV